MEINDLVKEAYETAKEKGWHDKEVSPLEFHALIHSEISEATEEARKNDVKSNTNTYQIDRRDGIDWIVTPYSLEWDNNKKPEGEAVELADAIIRIADYFGSRGWDLANTIKLKMNYNKTRSYRHGNKKY